MTYVELWREREPEDEVVAGGAAFRLMLGDTSGIDDLGRVLRVTPGEGVRSWRVAPPFSSLKQRCSSSSFFCCCFKAILLSFNCV